MNNGFNGYCEWFGIDTHGELMSFYRLLGLPEFEADRKQIESAAAARVKLLEPHMTGLHQQVAGRIINEVLSAKRCLCDKKLKAAYDAKLHKLNGSIPSPPSAAPTEATKGAELVESQAPASSSLPTAAEFFANGSGSGKTEGLAPLNALDPPTPTDEVSQSDSDEPDAEKEDTKEAIGQEEKAFSEEESSEEDDLYSVAGDVAEPEPAPVASQPTKPVKEESKRSEPKKKSVEAPQPSRFAEIWSRLEPHQQNLRYAGLAVIVLLVTAYAASTMGTSSPEVEARAIERSTSLQTAYRPVRMLSLALPDEQVVREHQELAIPLVLADPTATRGPVRFSLVGNAPAGMKVDSKSRLLWTPGEEDGGRLATVQVRASAGDQVVEGNLHIRVEEVNEPPQLDQVSDLEVDPGDEVKLQLSASDADAPAQQVTFEMLSGPREARLDAKAGSLRFRVPKGDGGREHLFVVRARDGVTVSPQQQFVVRVKSAAQPQPVKLATNQAPPQEPSKAKSEPPQPEKVRHEVPEDKAIQAADQLFRETFARDLDRSAGNEAKSQFAVKLLDQAGRLTAVPAEMYVLLQAAAELAVEAGAAPVAMRSADLLAENFVVSRHEVRAHLLMQLSRSRNVRSTSDQARLAEAAIDTVKLSIAADDLEVAHDMALLSVRVADSARQTDLVQAADQIKNEILVLDRQYPSLETALISANQPGALAETYGLAGSWLCLVRGDWANGLPLLAKGDEPVLQSTAALELAKPTDPMQQVNLADVWWEQAENARGITRWQLRQRAAHWYKTAQPHLQGLVKQKLAIRIEEVANDEKNPLAIAPSKREPVLKHPDEPKNQPADSGEFAVGTSRNLLEVLAADEKFSALGYGRKGAEFASLSAATKLPLPVAVSRGASYDLDLEFTMNGEKRTGLAVILPLGRNSGAVVLTDEKYSGLTQVMTIDKQVGPGNPSATKGRLRPRRRTKAQIRVQVDESDVRVLVTVDGTPVIDWRGSQNSISPHKTLSLRNSDQLALWTAEPGVVFHKVNFTLKTGTATQPR